jgi:hypothetical protein
MPTGRLGLKEDIRQVVEALFDCRPPHGDLWNEQTSALAAALRPPTRVTDALLHTIRSVLSSELAMLGPLQSGVESSADTTGNASVVFARVPSHDVQFEVLISDVYPVATRRVGPLSLGLTDPSDEWETSRPGAADLRFESATEAIDARLKALFEDNEILFLSADSLALCQPIRAGILKREPAAKYLFHLGVPTR